MVQHLRVTAYLATAVTTTAASVKMMRNNAVAQRLRYVQTAHGQMNLHALRRIIVRPNARAMVFAAIRATMVIPITAKFAAQMSITVQL